MENIVLIIGNGGREHAIAWKLSQSQHVSKIYVSPGNYGISLVDKVCLIDLDVKNNKRVAEWSVKNNISLVVVGPEEYLANGLADELEKVAIDCFGPKKAAANIEANKFWSKRFMQKHQIPTADYVGFTCEQLKEAMEFVEQSPPRKLVIKASGLAAGKGVIITDGINEAIEAVSKIMVHKNFGPAGESLIIEEALEGEEVSVLAFTDGKTIVPICPAQDHKRIFDGDEGPNTGGMGAYCPCALSENNYVIVKKDILQKAIDGLREDGIPFVGVLYAGLMITSDGPKVLEFNCRFGDPETQVILPLLKSDLFNIMKACCNGSLTESHVEWEKNLFAVGVVLASRGYPTSSSKGQVITNVDNILCKENHFVFHSGTSISTEGKLLTNGGRVLCIVTLAPSLTLAAVKARNAAGSIFFEGMQYRTDIAHKGIARNILKHGQLTYKKSGVDIEAGNTLVSAIKEISKSTVRCGTVSSIGGFGGLFDLRNLRYKNPILVSGTDGVGTKLKIAFEYKKHDTVGRDLVAMCVNDLLAHGAEPLFFLDYFACSKLDVSVATEVIEGISVGCKMAGCTLIGGETAEMPGMYSNEEYDLAGFAVGIVDESDLLPHSNFEDDDVVIGLPSSGLHSNGFSLVRKILKIADKKLSDIAPFSENNRTIGDELLEPTKIYVKDVMTALRIPKLVKAFAHITGGGLLENIPRVLPEYKGVELDAKLWKIQPIFGWLAAVGGVSKEEMLKTFNCGIGAILICAKDNVLEVLKTLPEKSGAAVIGRVTKSIKSEPRVRVTNFEESLILSMTPYIKDVVKKVTKPLKKVGVLISGSGTNLEALINATQDPSENIGAEIVLVISNVPNVEGLKRAERAGINHLVLSHTNYKTREDFDSAMNTELNAAGVEIVCLAGFMRILSDSFVKRWHGALINVHPSLLPSFKGGHAIKNALEAKVRVSGCTVHFVETEIDAGAIIEQATVPVFPNDTLKTLQKRIQAEEHRIFPLALKHLATGRIQLKEDNTIMWNY